MDSFATDQLKAVVSFLQLIVQALGCIDDESLTVNEKSLYSLMRIFAEADESRTGNIKGTVSEQLVALNDSIHELKTAVERTNSLLDYIDDSIGHANSDTGYIRIMPSDGRYWTT